MTELYFRLGSMEGFTSNTTADKKEGFDIPIRELTQNSLDATLDGTQCNIEITIKEIDLNEIPCIESYKEYLEKAIRTQTKMGAYRDQQKQVVDNLKAELKKCRIRVLIFADNGRGMDRDGLNALIEHRSKDKSESSGGSYGVGHLRPYDLSLLRYVLYATKHGGRTLFTGVPILAGFQDEAGAQRGNSGRIVRERPADENNPVFDYLDRVPSFLERSMEAMATGAVVCILGLTDKWEEDCETVIASHFFSALLHERLSVCIHRDKDQGIPHYLKDGEVERVLARIKEGRRPRTSRGEILSGQHTWQSFLAVRDSTSRILELSNGDRVSIYVRTEEISTSSVALIRSDMLIARHDTMLSLEFENLRKSDDFAPFALVVDINKSQAGKELFSLIKAAEGPYHNRLTKGELSKENLKRLRALLGELAQKAKDHLPRADREGFDLPIFSSIAASVNNDRKAKPAVPAGIGFPRRKKNGENGGGGGGDPRPPIFGRLAQAKIAARTERVKDGWRVWLRIVPTQDTRPADYAYLSFAVDEDSDTNVAGKWLTPVDVLVDGQPKKANNLVVSLGSLTHSSPIVVEAMLARPADSGEGLTVAIRPLVSLKRETRSKAKIDEPETGSTE